MQEILYKAVRRHLGLRPGDPGPALDYIDGIDQIDRVLLIDQSPIGRTPRSNPATYTGLMTPIRELFSEPAGVEGARVRAGRFSFNVASGRCEACEGDGVIRYEMHFLPGRLRRLRGVPGQAVQRRDPRGQVQGEVDRRRPRDDRRRGARLLPASTVGSRAALQLLADVGLGYIQLGQSATTLSGGEAQRIKIAFELAKTPTGRTLYLLDEPTTGLHFQDVERLLEVLYRLREGGNTVVVIEHNLDVLKCADWIIDLGPDGRRRRAATSSRRGPPKRSPARRAPTRRIPRSAPRAAAGRAPGGRR